MSSRWNIYAEMLKEVGVDVEHSEPFKEKCVAQAPFYRVVYPENWSQPTSFECQRDYDMINIKYIPYRRISHFREHLNRLQYCQFVYIPDEVLRSTAKYIKSCQDDDNRIYFKVKSYLKKKKWSKYNEHIHHMISKFAGNHIHISPEDHRLICSTFLQLEWQFKKECAKMSRKNLFSYFIVVQMILYLFHYHPSYKLPSLCNEWKQEEYYVTCLNMLTKIPIYSDLMMIHFMRKKNCIHCCKKSQNFDQALIKLI